MGRERGLRKKIPHHFRQRKNENTLQYKVPPKPRITHLRNHFWPLESGFSAIATYKIYVFSKSPNGPISKFLLVTGEVMVLSELLLDLPVLLIFVGELQARSVRQ